MSKSDKLKEKRVKGSGRRGTEKGEKKGLMEKKREEEEVSFVLTLTVGVIGVPAKSGHCLLKDVLSVNLETGVVVSVGEKTTYGGKITSLREGGMHKEI